MKRRKKKKKKKKEKIARAAMDYQQQQQQQQREEEIIEGIERERILENSNPLTKIQFYLQELVNFFNTIYSPPLFFVYYCYFFKKIVIPL